MKKDLSRGRLPEAELSESSKHLPRRAGSMERASHPWLPNEALTHHMPDFSSVMNLSTSL